jgi:hypothetical protein
MIFFIEIPTILTYNINTKDVLHVLHESIISNKYKFIINKETNSFDFNDECHYVCKMLKSFYDGKLSTQDIDPYSMENLEHDEIIEMMNTHFKTIMDSTPMHLHAFFSYCYQNFIQINSSTILRNEYSQEFNISWKHLSTNSLILVAIDFGRNLYNIDYNDNNNNNNDDNDNNDNNDNKEIDEKYNPDIDESTG